MIGFIFTRIMRSLPLIVFLALVAIAVYFVISYRHSPNRAKEVLIRLFTFIGLVLSAFFSLACIYAFVEHNTTALDFALGFLVVSLFTLGIARICRFVFVRHNPKYKEKATKTTKNRRIR